MSKKLEEISHNILRECLGLQKTESLLIVTDDSRKEIGEALYMAGKKLAAESLIVVMKEREKSGQEPPTVIAEAMKEADVVLCVTKHSLTHTKARKNAVITGTRIATMPGITQEMFTKGAITADYNQVKQLTEKVSQYLTNGNEVRIEKEGKVLTFSLAGRKGIASTGVYVNPGESGNLPSGEGYIAPIEGTASGQVLVDGSITGIGKLDSPLLLTLAKGKIVDAEGPCAPQLLHVLGEGDGRNLAEFGIGTNHKAQIIGVILEDEKVYGTIHLAFGSNITFGGKIDAGVHIDLVITEPDVFIDQTKIMDKGKPLI